MRFGTYISYHFNKKGLFLENDVLVTKKRKCDSRKRMGLDIEMSNARLLVYSALLHVR